MILITSMISAKRQLLLFLYHGRRYNRPRPSSLSLAHVDLPQHFEQGFFSVKRSILDYLPRR